MSRSQTGNDPRNRRVLIAKIPRPIAGGTEQHVEVFMQRMRLILVAMLLSLPFAASAKAEVVVAIGPEYVPAPVVYGPPVCEWGYYSYYPYACAPYGYYGPDWFYSGVFIGAGPWYGWGWRDHGWGGRGWNRSNWNDRGWSGRGGYGYRYGSEGGYRGGQTVIGGPVRGPVGSRGFDGGHSGGFSGGGGNAGGRGGFSGGGGHFGGGGGGGHR